jgi:hypothetical protein
MMFAKRLREGVRRGEITGSVRIWIRPHVRADGRYHMEECEIEVDSIKTPGQAVPLFPSFPGPSFSPPLFPLGKISSPRFPRLHSGQALSTPRPKPFFIRRICEALRSG